MGGHFDISKKLDRINEINSLMEQADFWNDQKTANLINSELSNLKKEVSSYNNILENINYNEELITLDNSNNTLNDVSKSIDDITKDLNDLKKYTYLNGEFDNASCYLEIHPGAGGTESCDWASMLLRMYERFCDKYGYTYEEIDYQKVMKPVLKVVMC